MWRFSFPTSHSSHIESSRTRLRYVKPYGQSSLQQLALLVGSFDSVRYLNWSKNEHRKGFGLACTNRPHFMSLLCSNLHVQKSVPLDGGLRRLICGLFIGTSISSSAPTVCYSLFHVRLASVVCGRTTLARCKVGYVPLDIFTCGLSKCNTILAYVFLRRDTCSLFRHCLTDLNDSVLIRSYLFRWRYVYYTANGLILITIHGDVLSNFSCAFFSIADANVHDRSELE